MEILAINTGSIEKFHQPIHHVADAMGIEMIITLNKLRPFTAITPPVWRRRSPVTMRGNRGQNWRWIYEMDI
jgi:hypothetical protein